MHVALISIGNCPSLALYNIKRYCQAHDDIRDSTTFRVLDHDLQEFRQARPQAALRWSFVTKFDETLAALLETRPSVIGFSCYLWNIDLSLHLAQLIKRVLPEVRTVFGGPDAGPRAEALLARHPQVDFVVEGDGEVPFLALLRALIASPEPDFSTVPALRYRAGGSVIVNPAGDGMVDLSLLERVYDTLPDTTEMAAWTWPYLLYETMRGCPYACSYCMYGKTPMNQKEPAMVVEELAELLDTGLAIEIIDPTFTTYKKRAKQILRGLTQHDYIGSLTFEAYPDSIDEEMAELMAQTRVGCVGIGFQTMSTEGLKAVRRPKNLERFERAMRLLQQYDIHFYVDLIYGLPQTTVDDFLATVDYLFDLGVYDLMIYRLLGLPGSPMMDDVEKYRLVFSEAPPYELLSSADFSLDDLLFCERFQYAYREILSCLMSADGRRWKAALGGVSELVRRFMDEAFEDVGAFREALKQPVDTGSAAEPAAGARPIGSAASKVPAAIP